MAANEYDAFVESVEAQTNQPGVSIVGSVTLKDPSRISKVWRGILATALISVSVASAGLVMVTNSRVSDALPDKRLFLLVAAGFLIAALILALGFGEVSLTFDPSTTENGGEDDEEE